MVEYENAKPEHDIIFISKSQGNNGIYQQTWTHLRLLLFSVSHLPIQLTLNNGQPYPSLSVVSVIFMFSTAHWLYVCDFKLMDLCAYSFNLIVIFETSKFCRWVIYRRAEWIDWICSRDALWTNSCPLHINV